MEIIRAAVLKKVYTRRKLWAHKGNYGRLAIIGGSYEFTGSCCFAGMAAYRAGCDLVYIFAPERAATVAAHFSPNLMTIPQSGHFLTPIHVANILFALQRYGITAIVIGPGLGREKETSAFVNQFIAANHLPVVIDADGIRACALSSQKCLTSTVFTPHANEFHTLTGITVSSHLTEKVKQVADAAQKLHAVVILKGHVDIISDGSQTKCNKTGSPLMTKGGMGDTLAGIAGAYLARNKEPFGAACAAAFVNGAAGAYAARRYREGVLATDLIECIPQVIK